MPSIQLPLRIVELPSDALVEYARVPSAFEVRTLADVHNDQRGGPLTFSERPLSVPYWKDYDAFPDEDPHSWRRFDLTRWSLFAAFLDAEHVGGAAIVLRAPGLDILEGRDDLAVIWDLRVRPSARRSGVGKALLRALEEWAVAHGVRELKVETQNVNVPACRLYRGAGYQLRTATAGAYPHLPDESRLLWYKTIPLSTAKGS